VGNPSTVADTLDAGRYTEEVLVLGGADDAAIIRSVLANMGPQGVFVGERLFGDREITPVNIMADDRLAQIEALDLILAAEPRRERNYRPVMQLRGDVSHYTSERRVSKRRARRLRGRGEVQP